MRDGRTQIGLSKIGGATGLGEGKTELKTWGMLFRESVAHWYTILLLSANPKSVTNSTQTLITINRSHL